MPAWTPVLKGSDADAANQAIDAIADQLEAKLHELSEPSLSSGHAGGAIFYEWLARARGEEKHRATAGRLLNQAIEWVGERTIGPAFYSGFTGVAWTLELLVEQDPDQDANEEIDPVLVEFVRKTSDDNYDVISGHAGLGVYFLRRLPRVTGQQGLEAVVQRLDELGERTEAGIAWLSPKAFRQRAAYEVHDYNLGLAHGIPGVIAVLGEIVGRTKDSKAAALLEGAVRFLLSQKIPNSRAGLFPQQAKKGERPVAAAIRPTWCYGDLGIAVALLCAARRTGNASWESEALYAAIKSAEVSVDSSHVVDTGFCHGFAGTGHLFNRLFNGTGNEAFRDAAERYFRRLLSKRGKRGIGGFESLANDRETWESEPGTIVGVAGIGLSLLAAVSPVLPEWDEMFLVSVPVL